MTIMYVLVEEPDEDNCETTSVLGVFETPEVSLKMLQSYFGEGMQVLHTEDVRDSGIEWVKTVSYEGIGQTNYPQVTLLEFPVGEIV